MLFNSLQFALFLLAVLVLHRSLPRAWRNPLLLGASLLFYTLWIPAYLLLLLVDIGVNYALLRAMLRSARPRIYLVGAVIFTLGLLGSFKYAALAVETAAPLLRAGFGFTPPVPEIFLPLGISFYSFQILALTIDSYRGDIEPPRSLARYALFVSFFPQLIAGPILRGFQFLPQLERGGRPNRERTRRGLWLLSSGIAKKVILADFLLSGFVNDVFSAPGVGSIPVHLVAAWSFSFQIYFDFSGYTDMARGIALLLGFELPFNFLEPYLARNPAEFWRRWHITLSRWLGDYLYIPLGGNRRGSLRTYGNLLLTMLLGGLWHGAAWNFVIWGGLHGILLVIHRRFGKRSGDIDAPFSPADVLRICLLFNVVSLIWIFFRAPSFDLAWTFLTALVTGGQMTGWPLVQTAVVALCMLLHIAERVVRLHLDEIQGFFARPWWGPALEGLAMGSLVGLAIAASDVGAEFIYFQF
jgi:alginate O-acetyltransferase complex protein AlgI